MTYYALPPDLQEAYSWLDDEAKSYPLEWDHGVLRFKGNPCVNYFVAGNRDRNVPPNLNDLWLVVQHFKVDIKEVMHFYRLMGVSLSFYGDVFTDYLL